MKGWGNGDIEWIHEHEMNAINENSFHWTIISQRLQFDQEGMGKYYWEELGKELGIRFGVRILRGNTETELEDLAFFCQARIWYFFVEALEFFFGSLYEPVLLFFFFTLGNEFLILVFDDFRSVEAKKLCWSLSDVVV